MIYNCAGPTAIDKKMVKHELLGALPSITAKNDQNAEKWQYSCKKIFAEAGYASPSRYATTMI